MLLAANLTFLSEIVVFVCYLPVLSVAKQQQQISDSTNSERSESVEYEPLTQQGRHGHWEITFFSERAVLALKIDEGKHCS